MARNPTYGRLASLLWLGLSVTIASAGCDKLGIGGSKDPEPTPSGAPAPEPTAAAPSSNEVIRYSTMEVAESGGLTIRQQVRARKAADRNSDVVDTLPVGTGVTRLARYGGFTLVQWNNGSQQGWVETAQALYSNNQHWDAGVWDAGFGTLGGQPTTPPPPVTTTPPPPTTTAPPPPPPPTTTTRPPPPPPPTTTTRPPPRPPPTTTSTRPGPRPPRLP